MELSGLDQTVPVGFEPVGAMPDWTQVMRRATRAHRAGRPEEALDHYGTALALACGRLDLALSCPGVLSSPDPDATLSAYVSSHLGLAAWHADQGRGDLCAQCLARAHQGVLRLVHGLPAASPWHQAAVWHSRDTHAALLAHWSGWGPDADVEAALRAGCLAWRTTEPAGLH